MKELEYPSHIMDEIFICFFLCDFCPPYFEPILRFDLFSSSTFPFGSSLALSDFIIPAYRCLDVRIVETVITTVNPVGTVLVLGTAMNRARSATAPATVLNATVLVNALVSALTVTAPASVLSAIALAIAHTERKTAINTKTTKKCTLLPKMLN